MVSSTFGGSIVMRRWPLCRRSTTNPLCAEAAPRDLFGCRVVVVSGHIRDLRTPSLTRPLERGQKLSRGACPTLGMSINTDP